MNWINPPEKVRRFTAHQIGQHGLAVAMGTALLATAVMLSLGRGGAGIASLHIWAGLASAALTAYHFAALLVIGIRSDITMDQAAFLPMLGSGVAGGDPGEASVGKYSRGERADYFACLALFLPVAVSGAALRWPGRFGIPGPDAFGWVRILHAAFGSAWVVHILAHHVPARWLRAPGTFRWAIVTGYVPLRDAEARRGWTADLVRLGVLVPMPSEAVPEAIRESEEVRRALEEGNRLARDGRYDEACRRFEEALRLFPEYSQARFNLGVARMRQGRLELAAEEFRKFLADDPFNPMAEQARRMLEKGLRPDAGETP